jgi:hypothetical protein
VTSELAARLVEALYGSGPDDRRYDDAVLRDAVPVLFLAIADSVDLDALPKPLERLVEDFLRRAGAVDAETAVEAIASYLDAHPIPDELWRTVHTILDEGGQSLSGDDRARLEKFSKFAGDKKGFRDLNAPAPKDSIPGGPLFRAKLSSKKDKK